MELTPEIFALRPYLFSISYNMLGMVEEAEDIVQDVFEKWISAKEVQDAKAYLARMAVNQSINRLKELQKSRENYVGMWLPEPYITLEPEPVPTLEYGMLFLLERLNPNERAVFILRESFSEDYQSIAESTGLSAENCRQLLHRAHEKLGRSKPLQVDPEKQRAFTIAFLTALHEQDRSELTHLLRNDIELYNDGGGKRAAALKPLFGMEKVLKFLMGVTQLPEALESQYEYRAVFVNGRPAAIIFNRTTEQLDSMQYIEMDDQGITRLLNMRNPDKLQIRGKLN
ncbi:sigma factor-like helix-turn-helix DNA-binding protein [Fluviicola chungangensis]|uniref:RNA polymerase subunit sigma-24 n=1 Tax=Fluviicola chungangensis TaxID=2597671 RepID=A0A556MJM5_9FLAO|nr:sigma factor-like helix-turn-helix DNA-binding protein [Fluviicola chungangensis]TSJ40079.1 RNA polymerase subunit sigma-24 [Fluviicola chungangensis]